MNKIFSIAWREFAATVFTKGFIMGIVMNHIHREFSTLNTERLSALKG